MPGPEIALLVAQLTNAPDAVAPDEFLALGPGVSREPGLYTWWVDAAGAEELSSGLGISLPSGLIYGGQAGATRSTSRTPSRNTLWGRVATMHLGGSRDFSTFRQSLGAVLDAARGNRVTETH